MFRSTAAEFKERQIYSFLCPETLVWNVAFSLNVNPVSHFPLIFHLLTVTESRPVTYPPLCFNPEGGPHEPVTVVAPVPAVS